MPIKAGLGDASLALLNFNRINVSIASTSQQRQSIYLA